MTERFVGIDVGLREHRAAVLDRDGEAVGPSLTIAASQDGGATLLRALDARDATPAQTQLHKGHINIDPASVYTAAAIDADIRALSCMTVAFAAVEDDAHVTPVLKLSAQLFISVQPAAGDDEDEHVSTARSCALLTCGGYKSPGLRRRWWFRWGPSRWTGGLRARWRRSRLPT